VSLTPQTSSVDNQGRYAAPVRSTNRTAQAWHLATAVIASAALLTQLSMTIRGIDVAPTAGVAPTALTRVIRYLSFFTVESNILVAVVAFTLADRPSRDGAGWRVLRLSSLIGIAVTGIIYATLLRPLVHLHGATTLTDIAFHYVVPVMAVGGWLLFGPRPRITDGTLYGAMAWPVLYTVYTWLHGAATSWYPYSFVDAKVIGYVPALRNGIGIVMLLLGVAVVFMTLDRWFAPDRSSSRVRVGRGGR
jgi:hypothetical protein